MHTTRHTTIPVTDDPRRNKGCGGASLTTSTATATAVAAVAAVVAAAGEVAATVVAVVAAVALSSMVGKTSTAMSVKRGRGAALPPRSSDTSNPTDGRVGGRAGETGTLPPSVIGAAAAAVVSVGATAAVVSVGATVAIVSVGAAAAVVSVGAVGAVVATTRS